MRPIILPANTSVFPALGTNGIGRLSDCYKCLVTEEINSTYTLTAGCQADSTNANLCVEGNYLYVSHDSTGDLQPFEIRRVKKKSDGSMEIYAEHISYKLTRMTAAPFEAASLTAALSAIPSNIEPTNSFTFAADFTSSVGFTLNHPMSARSLLNGEQGSIIDVYGQGEWEFDQWTCTLKQMRGADNGARIRSGHNLTELLIASENASGYKNVYPYYWDSYNGTLVRAALSGNTGRVVTLSPDPAPNVGDDVIPLDLTDQFTEVPSEARVRLKATKWLEDKKPWISNPTINVKYSAAVDDSASNVVLGDAVTVIDKTLGYNAKHRIVKTVWDVLYERYDSVGVGKLSPTLYDLIAKIK